LNLLNRTQSGLSFVELLVVIVIVSLVSTVLVQGLGFGLSLYQQVESRRVNGHKRVLVNHWFGTSSSALVVSTGGQVSLEGVGDRFDANSYNALADATGVATPISWGLIDGHKGSVLEYQQTGEIFILHTMVGAHRFEYQDHDGGWHSRWPLQDGVASMLPAAVRIVDAAGNVYVQSVLRTRAIADELVALMHKGLS
jgi:general secretion pathway protein J